MSKFEDKFEGKSLDELSEDEIKEMFLALFFWVAENRPDWLQEAINRKKKMLEESSQSQQNGKEVRQ